MARTPGPSTVSIHGRGRGRRPLVTPLVRSTANPSADGWVYSRFANPTVDAVAGRIAALEDAESAILVGSGTAAIACSLLATTPLGGTVVAASDVCSDARALLTGQLPELGRRVAFVDVHDLDGWGARLATGSATAYVETISNPALRIADVPGIAAVATAAGCALVVDATLSTPINQRPLGQGATLVVHSAGKYLNGHGDLIAGTIAGDATTVAAARDASQRLGACVDPAAAALLERGLKTLALRMEAHAAAAVLVARHLRTLPGVCEVLHPGLESHPDAALAQRLLRGGSGVVTFTLEGGAPAAARMAERLRLIGRAPTLGTAESLIWMPGVDRHPAEPRATAAVSDLVRLSVGLEDPADIVSDLDAALERGRRPSKAAAST